MTVINLALSGDNHTNTPGRKEEARRVHEAMLEDWKARGVHFIGLAGDWNEEPPDEQDQAWSRDFLGRCANVAPVVLIYGNHDPAGCLDEFASIHEYKNPIRVLDRPDIVLVETDAGPIAVPCVPFVWKAHLLAQCGPLSVEESDQRAQELLSTIFLGLSAKVGDLGLPTVALIHGKWRGSKLNEEQPNRPLGMEIPVESIGTLGAQVACVAHIHLAQGTTFNNCEIWTPSSPYYVDYGESKHEKGYIFCELPTDRELIPVLQRIPTPVTPMILAEYHYENEMFVRNGNQAHESDFDADGADIRLRFHYPKENEKAAKSAAKELADGFIEQGAVNVKLDPVPIPVESTRSLEIVKAKTLTEQAQLLWKKWDLKLSEQDEMTLCARIEEIQTACGFSERLTLDAGIHVKKVRMKGWRCFPDEVNLDFDAMPGEIVAVSGPNGTGKSLLWELIITGALFREVPTHGKIGDHAIARDTFIETEFEYAGKDYTVSQIIDGRTGNGSSSLHIDKKPVFGTDKALRSQYDEWAAANLPPLSLVTSTTFMPQESKGILGMGATARKSLILKAKGVERYEVLAEAARKRSTAVARELDAVKGRLAELRGYGQTVEYCEQVLAKATDDKRVADEALRLGELTLKDLQAKNVKIAKQQTEYEKQLAHFNALKLEEDNLRRQITELETKLAVNRELMAEEEVINDAVIEVANLSQHLDHCQEFDRDLRIKASKIENMLDLARAGRKSQEDSKSNLIREIAMLNGVYATKASVQATIDSIPDFEIAVIEAVDDRDGALKEYEDVQAQSVRTVETQANFLRGELGVIADGKAEDPVAYAGSALSADRLAVRDAADHPKLLAQAKAAWQQREQRAKEVTVQLESLRREAEKMPDVLKAGRRVADLEEEVRKAEAELDAFDVNIVAKEAELDEVAARISKNRETAAHVSKEIGIYKPLAAKAEILAGTKARIEEMELQLGPLKVNLESLIAEQARGLLDLSEPPKLINLAAEEQALAQARVAANTALSTFTLAEKALADAQAKEDRLQQLTAEVKSKEKAVDRWNLIERTVGRDGLIAESVAAAGDEINEYANALLRASGNTKYIVDLKTTKMAKDGKREIEGCPINIYNAETGEWQEGSTLSPGQRAFVNLPIALSLAKIGCKDSTVQPTIYIDEPTAALDPIARGQFLSMLRHVLRDVNASNIFCVTHNEELIALCDGYMEVSDGKVQVRSDPVSGSAARSRNVTSTKARS